MPHFTTDWFDSNIPTWQKELSPLAGKENLRFLEIGCFEGRATHWLCSNILTSATSAIDVVDTFEAYVGRYETDYEIGVARMRALFDENMREFGDRVTAFRSLSHDFLRLNSERIGYYDFIYLDGSHRAEDVYLDAILSWPLLKSGGLLFFDDYKLNGPDPRSGEMLVPGVGIDRFLAVYQGQWRLVSSAWQIHIEKSKSD